MDFSSLGEFELIKKISKKFSENLSSEVIGIGDDCSLIPINEELFQLTTTGFVRDPFIILKDNKSGQEVFYQMPHFDPRKLLYPEMDFKGIREKQLVKEVADWCER